MSSASTICHRATEDNHNCFSQCFRLVSYFFTTWPVPKILSHFFLSRVTQRLAILTLYTMTVTWQLSGEPLTFILSVESIVMVKLSMFRWWLGENRNKPECSWDESKFLQPEDHWLSASLECSDFFFELPANKNSSISINHIVSRNLARGPSQRK